MCLTSICLTVCNVDELWSLIMQQKVEIGKWQDRSVLGYLLADAYPDHNILWSRVLLRKNSGCVKMCIFALWWHPVFCMSLSICRASCLIWFSVYRVQCNSWKVEGLWPCYSIVECLLIFTELTVTFRYILYNGWFETSTSITRLLIRLVQVTVVSVQNLRIIPLWNVLTKDFKRQLNHCTSVLLWYM